MISYSRGRMPSTNNAWTMTTASFTVPNVGADVDVYVYDAFMCSLCTHVFVQGAGYYAVTSVDVANSLAVLNNTGWPGNAAPASVIASPAKVVLSGRRGELGLTGDAGTFGTAALHDTTHAPIGLWQLQGDTLDSSGNGYTLTVVGTPIYSELAETKLLGFYFNGATFLSRTIYQAALHISGALTIEMLLYQPQYSAAVQGLVCHGDSGELEVDNIQYQLLVDGTYLWKYFCEYGVGTDNSLSMLRGGISHGCVNHIALTRSAGQIVVLYFNGIALYTSTAQNTPTGGGDGRFLVGASPGAVEYLQRGAVMASLKIIGSALTANEVKAEFNRTLGPMYGVRI